jgi:hypothetical protein
VAIVVVGGSGRGVGKRALVCGLIAALTEFCWTAIKISTHEHGKSKPFWEETTAGTETDTARYLAAGAERAFLATVEGDEQGVIVRGLMDAQGLGAHLIFESNQVLNYVQPELCLAVHGGLDRARCKPSFSHVVRRADAIVAHSDADRMLGGDAASKPIFHLADLGKISPEMLGWVRLKLIGNAR